MDKNVTPEIDDETYKAGDSVSDWEACVNDFKKSYRFKHLWLHTAWRDIYLRYVNSYLGPLWITISMAVFIGCFSIIGASLFSISLGLYLPFLTISLITWNYISSTIIEGSDIFSAHAYLILDQRTPYFASVFRLLLRGLMILGHNIIIFIVVWLLYPTSISFSILFTLLGFILLAIFLGGLTLLTGVMSTKYRDIPQVIASILQVFLFLTPIMWDPDLMIKAGRKYIIDYNPFYHYLELIRNPLLGKEVTLGNISVSVVTSMLSILIGLAVFSRYRKRIAYWL